MVISPDGAVAYLGSDLGILRLDLNNNIFLPTFNGSGVVRAVSPDGTKVLATNSGGPTYVYDISTSTLQGFAVVGVTNGDFSVDSLKAMMVSGNTLYVYSRIAAGLAQVPLSGAASDLKFSPQGSVALAAEGSGQLLANCSNTAMSGPLGNVGSLLSRSNIAERMWGADGSNIYQIDFTGNYASTSSTDCTPQVSVATTPHSLGTNVTPVQLAAAPDGQIVYLVNDTPKLYASTTSGVTPISLTGGGTPLAAAVAPDGANLFVTASTGDIHRIDVASNNDVQQIAVGLKKADGTAIAPSMIVVRNK
jgi:DNA-binding beta-propeller fold protein YncE